MAPFQPAVLLVKPESTAQHSRPIRKLFSKKTAAASVSAEFTVEDFEDLAVQQHPTVGKTRDSNTSIEIWAVFVAEITKTPVSTSMRMECEYGVWWQYSYDGV